MAAPELRLAVGLDLTLLRQRISTIGTQLGGQPITLRTKFDRQLIVAQYRALDRFLSSKEFTLKIKDGQIGVAAKKAETLKKNLEALQETKLEIPISGKAAVNQREARKVRTGVYRSIMEQGGKILLPVGLQPLSESAVAKFRADVIKKLGSIAVNVDVGVQQQTGAAGRRPAGFAAARESIANLGVEQLRSRAFKSLGQESRAAMQVSQWLNTIVEQGIKGAAKTKQLSAIRDFLAEELAKRAGSGIEARMTGPDPNRRGAFPFIAKTGPIEPKALFAEAAAESARIDRANADRARRAAEREQALAEAKAALRETSSRLLPAGKTTMPQSSQQEVAVREFYRRVAAASDMFNRYFSANSHLPRSTQRLTEAMVQAASTLSLPAGKGLAGVLPSGEMVNRRKFDDAIRKAFEADARNAMRSRLGPQIEGRLLPSAGQTSFGDFAQRQLSGQKFRAPGILDESKLLGPMPPIAERLKNAAINFAKGAPVVAKYLNLFAPERINISDFPAANETPGQYIRRIQQALKEGPFGPGSIPSKSRFQYGQGPQAPGAPIQPLLPSAFEGGGDRVRGTTPEPLPERGGAIVPYAPKTRFSLDYYRNAVRYSEALKVATESTRNFSASQLPFVGGIRALGGELAMATKQVLLYGTAYKALAFVSSLPGQLINAAKGQQQFNNALQVATQDTNTFAKELLFVDNVQRAFGLNLETTRTGFTRLYASMAPANFDSGSIEKLFTGISAATAALQLTPDKAERVTYAFSQMASKGQIMAEELRGQLGDVLPGALSIFAKAAGMSIKDFSKAMEDGEFTGNRFREVFAKVSDELLNRFGTGAQAAGKSLQGLTNVVKSDFLRSLEALSPLADAAAKAILQPASSFLKQFQLSAKIATGELYRLEGQVSDAKKVVDELKIGGGDPQEIKAAEQSLAALQARYQALSQAAQDPAVMKQSEDIRRFTEELAKAGTVVMNIARAIGATLSPILSFLGGNLTTVVGTIVAFYTGFQAARLAALALMGALLAYRALSAILGFGPAALQAAALAKAFNVLGVSAGRASIQLIGVRTALMALTATTVIGLVVTGITLIAGAFGTMRDRAREAADASRDAARSAVEAARSGNVAQAAMSVQEILSQSRGDTAALKALESIYARSTKEQRAGAAPMVISAEEAVALEGSRLTEGMIRQVRNGKREVRVPSLNEMTGFRRQFGSQAGMHKVNLEQAKVAQEQAQQVATTAGFNQPSLPPALPESVDDKEKAKKEKDAEDLAKQQQALAERAADQQQQLILKTAEHRARLTELGYEAERDLTNERFEEAKRLIDYEYDYRLARANEVQAVQLNLEKKLAQARINSLRAVSERGLMLREAQMKVDTAKAQRAAASQAAAIPVPVTTAQGLPVGAPPPRSLPSSAASRLIEVANKNLGLFAGQTERCADAIRELYKQAGIAIGTTGRAWDGLTTGLRMASSFFGSDIGQKITRQEDLQPGDLVGFERTYGRWGPGVQTHVGMYAGGGMMYDHSSRRGLVKRPLSTFQGKFMYGVRPKAIAGEGTALGAPVPASGPVFSMAKREQGIEFNVEEAQAEQKVKTAIADFQLMNKVLEEARNALLAIGEAIGQALPTEQIKLDNQVLAERNRLILAGVPSEAIESAERLTRARGNYVSIETAVNNEIKKAEANLKLYDSQLANNTLSADDHAKVTKTLNDLLALHRKELASLPAALREFETETLKATLAQLKQADALKAVEEATAMVNSAVEGVVSSYKDLFVDIMSGGDIKEAAKKMQESLSKQVFTMFIDFSMKPVEKFFKDQLLNIFGLPNEESKRAEVIAQMERQIAALDRNTAALQSPGTGAGTAAPSSLIPAGAGFGNLEAVGKAGELAQGATEKLFELPAAMSSLTQASENITANFAQATGALVQQSQAGAVAASVWQQNLGKTVSAVGIAASSIMGITAGVSQIKEGGISGVLGGIGSIAMSMGSLLGGFGGLGIFGGGGTPGGSGMPWNFNSPIKFFANGGVVNGPTLGMVGEGRYSEAIVPLPDGRSIPVKMSDQSASLRDAMNTMSPLTAMAPILSMKFETTNIGGVEYVSRDQLEAAMATTRRQAAKDGAMRGMNMTLDKIQQSPATRGRLGMRRG